MRTCKHCAGQLCSVLLLILAAAILFTPSQILCQAQAITGTDRSAAAAPAAQAVYEAGDVYVPASRVFAFVGKTGFGHEHGVVGRIKQGRIQLAAAQDAGALVFDMTSFVADSTEARKLVGLEGPTDASTQQQVTANMLGSAVLDAAHYPTASFTIKRIARLPEASQRGLPQYQLSGDFWLHGVTRPIQVVAEAQEQDNWIHLRGAFSILQSTFGITPFSKAFGAVGVTDQLNVWGDLWVSKQRQVAARPIIAR